MIGILMGIGKIDVAKDLFLSILPVASAVISFWFASRNSKSQHDADNHSENK